MTAFSTNARVDNIYGSSSIENVTTFQLTTREHLDEEGILRVGGRLSNAQEDVAFRFPAIIPKGTIVIKEFITLKIFAALPSSMRCV